MEMWIKCLVISILYVTLLTSCSAQDRPGGGLEHGVIMTVFDPNNVDKTSAQIAHIPVMPYYENISSSVKGLRFNNSKITFLSVDVDYREKTLFLYDYYLRSIVVCYNYTGAYDPDYMTFEAVHVGISKGTVQIAYDWLSKTLYWVDSGYKWVMAIPAVRAKIEADVYKIIVDENLEEPDGLTLDPVRGVMFWSDNGKHPKIEKANLDGSERTTIISAGLNSPRSMEADLTTQRIFWTDSYAGTIESADYYGKNRAIVRRLSGTELLDIAIYRETLMVTNMYYGETYVLNKTDGSALRKSIQFKKEKIYGLSVYNIANQPMATDYCSTKNCPHFCISQLNGAKCVCADGYTYNSTTGNCSEVYGQYHRAIVIATPGYICLLDFRSWSQLYTPKCVYSVLPYVPPTTTTTSATTITPNTTGVPPNVPTAASVPATTTPTPTVPAEDQIKWMDVDMVNRVVYFSTGNNSIFSRPLDLPIDTPTITKITDAVGTISGLAFDWVDGNNLYYSVLEGTIHVVNVLDRNSKKISKTTIYTKPRNLVMMPLKRRLAWISGDSLKDYSVEGMGITGMGHSTYRTDLVNPIDLVADPDAQVFYILDDSSRMYRHPYNTTTAQTATLYIPSKDATSFLKYKDYLGIVYDGTNNASRWKTYTTTTKTYQQLDDESFPAGYNVVSIRVLDKTVLKRITDLCADNNGDCDQLCQMVYENDKYSKICSCSLGYSLADDAKKCETSNVMTDEFALVTDWTNDIVYQMNLKNPEQLTAFKTEKSGTFVGVLYNRVNKTVIWTELSDGNIYQAALDGSNFNKVAYMGYYYPNRLALDEGTGNIYFTTRRSYFNFIGVVSPKSTSYFKVLDIANYRLKLRDIVLHPKNGKMYYCAYDTTGGIGSYVGRADMDGKNDEQIQNGSAVYIPLGLAIDYYNSKIYWTDYYYDTVTQCDLDGKTCKVIVKELGADMHDVDTDSQYIYLTAWNQNHLERRPISNFDSFTKMGTNPEIGKLEALSVYRSSSKNIQPPSEYCKARGGLGRCSTLCLPKSGGASCGCLGDTKLLDDGRTCIGVPQCDAVIDKKMKVNGQTIEYKVTIEKDCLRYVGETCLYSCPSSFEPVPNPAQKLECRPDGWDKQFDQLCKVRQCPAVIPNGKFEPSCLRVHGAKCSYTCQFNYKAIVDHVVCTNSDVWSVKLETLCTDKICSPTILNGAITTSNCPLKGGTKCQFTCNNGYTKTITEDLACRSDGKFSHDPTKLCKVTQCAASIPNGVVSTCSRMVGVACDYTCNSQYTKPIGRERIVCLTGGKWDTDGLAACTDKCNSQNQRLCSPENKCIDISLMCDGKTDCSDNSDENDLMCRQCKTPFPNGAVSSSCSRTSHGDMCDYTCASGYINVTDKVTCTSSNKWDPPSPCIVMLCPTVFNNGKVNMDCDRKPNGVCNYACNLGLDPNKEVGGKIQCLSSGTWNLTQQMCVERVVVNMGQSGEAATSSASATTALAVVLALAIVALIAIIVFIVVMRRRSKHPDELPYARASFRSSGSGIAMENPGYLATNGSGVPQNGREVEQPYDNPTNFSPIELRVDNDDTGIVNPMYSNQTKEPLPEVSQMGMNGGDKDVLTADSWLKEQRKNPAMDSGKNTDA